MKIFELHWVWHLLYLAALAGVAFWGKNQLTQTAFLKKELGAVQQIALPKIQDIRNFSKNEISKNVMAYPAPQNLALDSAARQAIKLVEAFEKKCYTARERFRNGTRPEQINWRLDLLDDFYFLGDSLSSIYKPDSSQQVWLERCLFSGYRDFPPEQLASLLSASDTADAARVCQNLHLKAELALLFVLENLRRKVWIFEMRFDGLMPVLAPRECPRAGAPFKAEIFFASYSSHAENVRIKVNGKSVPVEAGLGHYTKTFTRPGEHKLSVEIQVRNPLIGEIKTYIKDFATFVSDTTEMR